MNSLLKHIMKPRFLRLFFAASVVSVALASCAGNPTGGANFVLMSESSEIEKGKELHQEMLEQNQIYEDPELQAYLEKIGQKIRQKIR